MQSDRELLELAAKAAGYELHWRGLNGVLPAIGSRQDHKWWNPLTDDGDALRLAVKLRITVEQDLLETKASAYVLIGAKRQHFVSASGEVTRHEATRRAIVLAAAKMAAQPRPTQHNDGGAVYE